MQRVVLAGGLVQHLLDRPRTGFTPEKRQQRAGIKDGAGQLLVLQLAFFALMVGPLLRKGLFTGFAFQYSETAGDGLDGNGPEKDAFGCDGDRGLGAILDLELPPDAGGDYNVPIGRELNRFGSRGGSHHKRKTLSQE